MKLFLIGPSAKQKISGLTLYEMLVSLGIISIVASTSVGMFSLVANTRLTTHINLLLTDLSLTRSEAVKRGHPVTLCKTSDGQSCSKNAHWGDGWIIFSDPNKNHEREETETTIRHYPGLPQSVNLRYGETGNYYYVTYYPTGYVYPNGTFTLCDKRGAAYARAIIMQWSGRPRSAQKNAQGGALNCPIKNYG